MDAVDLPNKDNVSSQRGGISDTSSKDQKADTPKGTSNSAKLESAGEPGNPSTSAALFIGDTDSATIGTDDDKANKYRMFLQNSSDQYTVQQMERFLKHGISDNGMRMLTTDTCTWVYDYYKTTKTSTPNLKELTPGTTVDYYYYSTPFRTQIGDIDLVMMHSQVNFEDGTAAPADRVFKMNEVTPEMVKAAKVKARQYKNECIDWI
ncbi:conserved Plasmodium protein, unknown function [Plasmodium knowlesi strain H]|uniref:Uncharacterized protein n=3 Tax=Plasmodium knowlesi TaxID=5850 RepID=A0A5K1UT43_PLAKH|nr:conserved protein, unknown function [Plasmodium knowlesi strain H]OTN67096.1 Uncharacterized protein PKNOH_S07452400 [Plasmodium knowlesi]CAA9988650.1 conserved protein, unknown function [Plasmodium knowlesi strain H]SBO21518.1 conserved Plasmodium protein, unknown function [Plasmodium knowlesi strain H]SBO21924.1 conserved Plasmodium protein, unknown function [Plasmodium knowlesi strain H]VVS78124.1 conserved protein, unknown function [Plasmodium knowlesi strain H]|eukprot:XP_002259627.1 hypothetical protein, conserved in Plasmodium species [Plasmodium knowlesi strain H]